MLFENDFAPGWDVVQIEEFSSKEQARYLGSQRFANLPHDVQEILGVPRVLYYLRKTPETEFQQIRNASDVYSVATIGLMEEGLRASESRDLSPESAKLLLSAIAFEMSLDPLIANSIVPAHRLSQSSQAT
jgi:hypothetical protein